MKQIATLIVLTVVCLHTGASVPAQQTPAEQEVLQIVAQSQEALTDHNEQKSLDLIKNGLVRFPDNDDLKIQLARIYVQQKHDRQALGLLDGILLANPSSRNAKLALAQLYGYRENYRQSDRLYQELLSVNPDDEAAALGLVHNLMLEGRRAEARLQVQQAITRHPTSLELQQYSDYLAENPGHETQAARTVHRVQNTESFFSDTSGNRSVYSSQGITYQFSNKLTSRVRVEETSLWRTGTITKTMLSGAAEGRYRLNKYVAVRSGVGAVRFVDANSRVLYAGDLELFPFKSLLLSGGFSRYPVAPTFDSTAFDLLAEGWHSRAD